MPKYVIERRIPDIGSMSAEELHRASCTSNDAVAQLAPKVQWLHSYVLDDRTHCVYIAESEELIREHARLSGFPADEIRQVHSVIDPTTGET